MIGSWKSPFSTSIGFGNRRALRKTKDYGRTSKISLNGTCSYSIVGRCQE